MNRAFWANRRVFVTGHTGFKGSWLSLLLQEAGARVSGYALAPETTPNLFDLAQVADGMESTIADVRDLAALRSAMARAQPEVVFHLAAQSVVRLSYDIPVETYATNVMGTVHVLEAIRRQAGVRAAVIVTSDKCYENREWPWGYRENEPLGGHDPYSSSKGCAELVSSAYRASFFTSPGSAAIATARAGNVIGGGDWTRDRLIPDIMRGIAANEIVQIRNPGAIRPWQHVLEPLRGYVMLAERLAEHGAAFAEAWNFGPHDADCRPVRWIVERLSREWEGARWEIDDRPRPHEANYLKLDSSKAIGRLGWSPRWELAGTIHSIVEWHRAHLSGADIRRVTIDQIAQSMQWLQEEPATP